MKLDDKPKCIQCSLTSERVPLIKFAFNDIEHWICTMHLPLLIHKPEQLAEKLEGATSIPPSSHNHH